PAGHPHPGSADRAGERGPVRIHGQRARLRGRQHLLPRMRGAVDRARLVRAGGVEPNRRRAMPCVRRALPRGVRRAARRLGQAPASGSASVRVSALGVRPAVAAGTFYPDDPQTVAATVDALVDAGTPPEGVGEPKGLIVPHAGYRYSGPVAATAYSLLARIQAPPVRVCVLGPAHFVGLRGASLREAAAWATPLGPVPVDPDLKGAAAS